MIEQIAIFFSIEMIYLWLNIGIIPFWFILIIFPQSKICGIFITSIFPMLILGSIYIYLFYYFLNSGYNFFESFHLYIHHAEEIVMLRGRLHTFLYTLMILNACHDKNKNEIYEIF